MPDLERIQNTHCANLGPIGTQTNYQNMVQIIHENDRSQGDDSSSSIVWDQSFPLEYDADYRTTILPKTALHEAGLKLKEILPLLEKLKRVLPRDVYQELGETYHQLRADYTELSAKGKCQELGIIRFWKAARKFARGVKNLGGDLIISSNKIREAALLRFDDEPNKADFRTSQARPLQDQRTSGPATALKIGYCCRCNNDNPSRHCGPRNISPIQEGSLWSPCIHGGDGCYPTCTRYTLRQYPGG